MLRGSVSGPLKVKRSALKYIYGVPRVVLRKFLLDRLLESLQKIGMMKREGNFLWLI